MRATNLYDEANHQRRLWTPQLLPKLVAIYDWGDDPGLQDRVGNCAAMAVTGTHTWGMLCPQFSRKCVKLTGQTYYASDSRFNISGELGFCALLVNDTSLGGDNPSVGLSLGDISSASGRFGFDIDKTNTWGGGVNGFYHYDGTGVPAGVHVGSGTFASGQPSIIFGQSSSSAPYAVFSLNGKTATASPDRSSALSATTNGKFGFSNSGFILAGYYAFLLAFSGSMSVDDRNRIEGWAGWRWGVQAYLPATHPYRNKPPLLGF